MHWIILILGVLILSLSLSNPFYKITIKKIFKINKFTEILLRISFFFISIIIIIFALYIESLD
ncbi:MAG: hypothetical protein CFH19_00481 [Alphaproteobacteria bacterium MarineAlpha5_Bin9]|nr:MAG: hypothetical protein CFH19_00481 [Alphaproteobacteria bacterium MarineAlpha5_Bin9]